MHPDLTTDEIVRLIQTLPAENLFRVRAVADRRIGLLTGGIVKYVYDELRLALISLYSIHQVSSVKTWDLLTTERKEEFTQAFTKAQAWLQDLGVDPEVRLALIRNLMFHSHFLKKGSVSFQDLLDTIINIEDCFATGFPGYDKGAIQLLNFQLKRFK